MYFHLNMLIQKKLETVELPWKIYSIHFQPKFLNIPGFKCALNSRVTDKVNK